MIGYEAGIPATNCPVWRFSLLNSDGDSFPDVLDNCPYTFGDNYSDTDQDGVGNICDNCIVISNPDQADSDADGKGDVCDNCPTVYNPTQVDSDGDGIGNACDDDNDNDGVSNAEDNCPSFYNPSQDDIDQDGIGDACEFDIDNDGINNAYDNCLLIANTAQTDTDNDGWGDACDNCPDSTNIEQVDWDHDGAGNVCDNCLTISNPDQSDQDSDGRGDACDNCPLVPNPEQYDSDYQCDWLGNCYPAPDGVGNLCDNCPDVYNPDQADFDQDGLGDACDPDDDNDGIQDWETGVFPDQLDNCLFLYNPEQEDQDNDGIGDQCDNCPVTPNPGQEDQDNDGIGDLCDNDQDGDGTPNESDNCPLIANSNQADQDNDGIGDLCDNCPTVYNPSQVNSDNDSFGDACDNCPLHYNPSQADTDQDLIGDACDIDARKANIHADHDGTFLFADNHDLGFNSGAANEFAVRATGGVRFVTAIDGSGNPTQTMSIAGSGAVSASAFIGDGSLLTNVPGDGLGNHLATQTLNLNNHDLANGGTVTASAFVGDGSGLTNIPVDNLGNHSATQNIVLNAKFLSGDGDDEGVYVSGEGNVGINTTTPGAQLEIKGLLNQPNLEISDIHNEGIYRRFGITPTAIGVRVGTISNDPIIFTTNDTERLVILNSEDDGRIGIGTLYPSSELDVNGTITANAIAFPDGSALSSAKGIAMVAYNDFSLEQNSHIIQLVINDGNSHGGTFPSTNDYDTRLTAAVHLPHGAEVTKVTFYGYDASSSRNIGMSLRRSSIQSTSYGVMSSHDSNIASGVYSFADESINFSTINNNLYRYYVQITPVNGNWYSDGQLAVNGIKIEYTME